MTGQRRSPGSTRKEFYGFRPERLTLSEYPCSVETLDEQNLDPIFIKIDVQGTEYEVIRGGLNTIKRYEPILLIENLHGDSKLVELVRELAYEEYWYGDNSFTKERTPGSNTFLLPRSRLKVLDRDYASRG